MNKYPTTRNIRCIDDYFEIASWEKESKLLVKEVNEDHEAV